VSTLVVAAACTLVTLSVTAAPAHARVYGGPGSNLCTPGDNRVIVPMGASWVMGRVHATSDFTENANGVSFRTCSWRGTNHTYQYSCAREDRNGWQLHLVGRGSEEARRVRHDVVCDGRVRTVRWTLRHDSNEPVHYHLWAPGGTDCGESCARYLEDWTAWVS
jgi:hypothetical protein